MQSGCLVSRADSLTDAIVPVTLIFAFFILELLRHLTVMLSPRGQAGLEAKILSSASSICPRHVLELFVLAS